MIETALLCLRPFLRADHEMSPRGDPRDRIGTKTGRRHWRRTRSNRSSNRKGMQGVISSLSHLINYDCIEIMICVARSVGGISMTMAAQETPTVTLWET